MIMLSKISVRSVMHLTKKSSQGKKQLIEFVNAFSNDKSIQTTVAQWLASRKKMAFDRDTIPQELLDSA